MVKRKYPSELNTRNVRVNVDDWQLLTDLSRKLNKTMADALTWLLARHNNLEMMVKARSITPLRSTSTTAIVTNGSKVTALGINPKGARYDD
jgi:type VI protein secretion system component VasF